MALGNTRENGVRTLVITRVARSAAITKRRLHVRQYGPNYLKDNKSGGRGVPVRSIRAIPHTSKISLFFRDNRIILFRTLADGHALFHVCFVRRNVRTRFTWSSIPNAKIEQANAAGD